MGTGVDLARLDIYYGDQRLNDFLNVYVFARIKPWKQFLLSLKAENRTTIFSEVEMRFLANLSITFSRPGTNDFHF